MTTQLECMVKGQIDWTKVMKVLSMAFFIFPLKETDK